MNPCRRFIMGFAHQQASLHHSLSRLFVRHLVSSETYPQSAHPNKILVMLAQAHPRPSQIRELEVWDIRLPISYRHPIHHQMDIEHLHHALRQVRVRTIAQ
ncbi:hypothetical protein FOTG_16295 [Fusarium oxysporum f. sp. vasinfectum 25433]|uniref:Uncharacterized protein n=1 Tax=Fusarium oxysporum f. sp. vasinfectum 25433 TaxID=1089449 RepID=X0M3Z1_FUSOX|nr:hypothetical protein FOTG_16295 [Fusarium oxysporum f. sp. vasinfectum 25433]